MSFIQYQLQTTDFPDGYAEILKEVLAITPGNFLGVKDALYHFRFLDDDQAAEVMAEIGEQIAIDEAEGK